MKACATALEHIQEEFSTTTPVVRALTQQTEKTISTLCFEIVHKGYSPKMAAERLDFVLDEVEQLKDKLTKLFWLCKQYEGEDE